MDFKTLKKYARQSVEGLAPYRLAVLGDCATQHLATALKGAGIAAGLGMTVFDADYNQIDAQTMDPTSELYEFHPDGVLLHMCTEKLYEAFCAQPLSERADFAAATYGRIRSTWARINANTHCAILQFGFVAMDDNVFGSFAPKTADSFPYQLQKLNSLLMDGCQEVKNVYLVDLNAVQLSMGRERFCDPKLYYIAKMPISLEALPEAARRVIDTVLALKGRVKKCVVLDLDNTLWGGVIGDDGLNGIQIGELGLGHAFTEFQMWLKELKNRGILLAVCSKNNEDTAKEPFLKHPEMVLRLEDISVFVANWQDKAANIRYIQHTLNIGMDSLVFLDDNPFERNLVRDMIPEITVPELPEDPAMYLRYLRGLNLFEMAAYSKEDANRTRQYREQAERSAFETSFENYDAYLQGLQMQAVAAPFDGFHYPRIAQLTQRSNQFNLRTVRYTEAEVAEAAQDPSKKTLYFTLKDRFGDHGLISVVVMEGREDTLFISQWLMSCRVLKRGMEAFIINKMLETAKNAGFARVMGEYLPTPKNAMVKDIYKTMGFTPIGDGRFVAEVSTFQPHETFITEE